MAALDKKIYRTGHLVDTETSAFFLNPATAFVINESTLPAMREGLGKLFAADVDTTGVVIKEKLIPSPNNAPDVKVYIYSPEGNTKPIPGYLDIHGGGFILGTATMGKGTCVQLARELNIVVVSVEYRLAPEHPGTAEVEDCYTAFLWMHEHGHEEHIDASRLAFGGASAGGGLSAALGLLVRDRKQIKPIFQLLIYPMLDDRTCLRDSHGHTGEFGWTPEQNVFGWSSLLGKGTALGSEDTSYYLVPARAKDLSGLPPTYISTGALDLFLEEDIEYARKLIAAGVPTELHVYPGMAHGADSFVPSAKLSKRFKRDYVDALRHFLTSPKE